VLIGVGERSVKAKHVKGYTPPAPGGPMPDYRRFVRHPRVGHARLVLLPIPGQELREELPFRPGTPSLSRRPFRTRRPTPARQAAGRPRRAGEPGMSTKTCSGAAS